MADGPILSVILMTIKIVTCTGQKTLLLNRALGCHYPEANNRAMILPWPLQRNLFGSPNDRNNFKYVQLMNFLEELRTVKNSEISRKKGKQEGRENSCRRKLHLKFSLLGKISRSSRVSDTRTKRICFLMYVSHQELNGVFCVISAISFYFERECTFEK